MNDVSPDGAVSIAPGVSMLGVLAHLRYSPWFALAEYVDNSVQSALTNIDRLRAFYGETYALEVSIDIDLMADNGAGCIRIADNAAGIAREQFGRAFRTAMPPPDRSGLSEFGMGMKSASCWFAREWEVRTRPLGDSFTYSVLFRIDDIVVNDSTSLDVSKEVIEGARSGTEVVLRQLNQRPVGRQIEKTRLHLTSIYRRQLESGQLVLKLNGRYLAYERPAVLRVPSVDDPDGPTLEWVQTVDYTWEDGRRASGFVALRERTSAQNGGIALFRRNRLIQGGGSDDAYRPEELFQSSGSFRAIRMFGELDLEGFGVTHTKDSIDWSDHEDDLLGRLREDLAGGPLRMLRQVDRYRRPETSRRQQRTQIDAINSTNQAISRNLPRVDLETEVVEVVSEAPANEFERVDVVQFMGTEWQVHLESHAASSQDSLFTRTHLGTLAPRVQLLIRVNTNHPFIINFTQGLGDAFEAIIRMIVALAVSEVVAEQSGIAAPSAIVRNVNACISQALSSLG